MAMLLTHEDVLNAVTMGDAVAAMEDGFREEGEGHALVPARLNVKFDSGGWLRVGPVAMQKSGWMGFKAMNLTPGLGVRYQVHLYDLASGSLCSIMDAQHLTTLRTGATSAVATRCLARPGAHVTALLGSGAEAQAQLDAMLAIGAVKEARIFSPTAANRERLAQSYQNAGVPVRAVSSAREACSDAELILAAVKSTEPVLQGKWLSPGVHVNSVGTARRDQREIDVSVFKRASRIVVDTLEGVFGEAGDAVVASEEIEMNSVTELSQLVTGAAVGRTDDSEITLFKSVGTGVQDIVLAARIYERALELGLGTDFGEFPILKRNK